MKFDQYIILKKRKEKEIWNDNIWYEIHTFHTKAMSSLEPESKYWSSLLKASLIKYVVHRKPSYTSAKNWKWIVKIK